MNNDLTIRRKSYEAAKEIKASAHYSYIANGITLDGSKFSVNEYVPEGQCLVKNDTSGKYEKYAETTAGTFPTGYSNPVILDESIRFKAKDDGTNPDVTAGQVIVHGSVYTSMLTGCTKKFKETTGGSIRFVD
ncbi:MAG: hypothetical protein RSE04_05980 [Hydrogenoanaerobacterium sp.]